MPSAVSALPKDSDQGSLALKNCNGISWAGQATFVSPPAADRSWAYMAEKRPFAPNIVLPSAGLRIQRR